MNELKMLQGESFEQFVVRTLNESENKQETYKTIFDKDLAKDETRKRSYLAQDIQNAIEQNRDRLFLGESVIEIGEGLNECYKSDEVIEVEDKELLLKSNQNLRKQLQKSRDDLRILRAEDRGNFRISDKIDYMLDKCLEIADSYPKKLISATKKKHSNCWAIAHLSDTHVNKVVNLPHNKYDYSVAKQRTKNYFTTFKHDC